jgi:aldose 1-epimerase
MITTGKQAPLQDPASFQAGLQFGELRFDNVFTGLAPQGGRRVASVHDPDSGRTLTLTFDAEFRECVFYIPPHRKALCIEPYTCAPDPFRLSASGVDAGLRVLAPGESFQAAMEVSCQ